MKYAFLAAALLMAAGCQTIESLLDPVPSTGRPRGAWGTGGDKGGSGGTAEEPDHMDKKLYITAVEYPDGYNWASDTLFGASGAKIDLFCDGRLSLSVPTGAESLASPDADMHHFLEGHLYTEYSDASRTYIGRDGRRLFSYEGREILKGLLTLGDDVYTLAQDRSGEGITLRKNGEMVFKRAGCLPCGDLSDIAYSPSGALYMDEGNLCFGFMEPSSGCWYLYCDAAVRQLAAGSSSESVYDVRRVGGRDCILSFSGYVLRFSVGGKVSTFLFNVDSPVGPFRIVGSGDRALCFGTVKNRYDTRYETKVWSESGQEAVFEGRDGWIYDWDGLGYCVAVNRLGRIVVYGPEFDQEDMTDQYYLSSYRCACLTDKGVAVALTPAGGKAAPFIYTYSSDTPVNINGFITGLYWE